MEQGIIPKQHFQNIMGVTVPVHDDIKEDNLKDAIQSKLNQKLSWRPTMNDLENRGIVPSNYFDDPMSAIANRRKSIELKKQQLNEKLSLKRRPSVADLVAEKIMPEDSEVINELKNIAKSHRRMRSAVQDLSTRLPFENETNLQVAQTMMRHINDTEDDINLSSDNDNDEQQDRLIHKRRLSQNMENFLMNRPTIQDLENNGVLKQDGIANSLRASALSLEEKINQKAQRQELIHRNIIKRPNISHSLQPNAQALEDELIKNLEKSQRNRNPSYYKHDIAPRLQQSANQLQKQMISREISNALQARPDKKELIDSNILYKHGMANKLQGTALELEQQLKQRVPQDHLQQIGILYNNNKIAPSIQSSSYELENALKRRPSLTGLLQSNANTKQEEKNEQSLDEEAKESVLNWKLRQRPSIQELEARGIIPEPYKDVVIGSKDYDEANEESVSNRKVASDKIKNKLDLKCRPTKQDLVDRGIVLDWDNTNMAQENMQRNRELLAVKIKQRMDPQEAHDRAFIDKDQLLGNKVKIN